MKIHQYKKTNIAWAPDELSKAINKYSTHQSVVTNDVENCDLIHFHNTFCNHKKKSVIQYHSEPFRVNLAFSGKKLVISQYHAILKEYRDCQIVRNVLNFEDPIYELKEIKKLKVGFSPSITHRHGFWYNKGFAETKEILDKLKSKYRIDYDIITKTSLENCIKRKSECSVIIDECVTPSWHRCTLEGLALGKLTICSVSPEIEHVMLKSSGAETIPFKNVWIQDLEEHIKGLLDLGIQYINDEGYKSRKWMEEFWHPKDIVKEFTNIYEQI